MAYSPNPFLSRMSERTVSDSEFVSLFSPNVLEKLDEDILDGKVTIFRSPPGGGKTTILRTFTPGPLRSIWDRRKVDPEAYKKLVRLNAIDPESGPKLFGLIISCSSGYADLPPGASTSQTGLFRALLNCRIVLKTIRTLSSFSNIGPDGDIDGIEIEYSGDAIDLKTIPQTSKPSELLAWAEAQERKVYSMLDDIAGEGGDDLVGDVRFEGFLWLNSVKFNHDGRYVAEDRLIMIDDVQSLREQQRSLLISEIVDLRLNTPTWISMRDIAIGESLLSQGVRENRELRDVALSTLWAPSGNISRYTQFAQNILDRRLKAQNVIAGNEFSDFLKEEDWYQKEYDEKLSVALAERADELSEYRDNVLYQDWLDNLEHHVETKSIASLIELHRLKILIARNENNKQLSFDLMPIPAEELDTRDSSALVGAAEIFAHRYDQAPYYFGMESVCRLSMNNIEELLSICGALYEKLKAKNILNKDLHLSPAEQDKIVRDVAKRKREFIKNSNTHGMRAQRLIDSMGEFCMERTFKPNAPIAPGVTGFRLSLNALGELSSEKNQSIREFRLLRSVLSECIAENLLFMKESSASTNRPPGYVFYLNRLLCSHYKLPLSFGGWSEVEISTLVEWMENTKPRQAVI